MFIEVCECASYSKTPEELFLSHYEWKTRCLNVFNTLETVEKH